MIFENYSYILTSNGFQDIRTLLNERDFDKTKIAYINSDGKLDFTNEYVVEKDTPENIVEYSDDLFLSFISDANTEFYVENTHYTDRAEFIKTNLHNAKNILVSYDCFKDVDVCDVDSNILFNDGTYTKISYKNLIKLFILYSCFGSQEVKPGKPSLKLYTNFNGDFYKLSSILRDILGKDRVKYFKSATKSTFYIDSEYLYNYFTDTNLKDNMLKNMINNAKVKNSAYLVCQAIIEITNELKYRDNCFQDYSILFGGRNLVYASFYLQACLAVCGYKSYFRRQVNGKFKLMYVKQDSHYFIDNVRYCINELNREFYTIKTKETLPIFILEIRNYLQNICVRPTHLLEDRNVDFSCSYNILGDD